MEGVYLPYIMFALILFFIVGRIIYLFIKSFIDVVKEIEEHDRWRYMDAICSISCIIIMAVAAVNLVMFIASKF